MNPLKETSLLPAPPQKKTGVLFLDQASKQQAEGQLWPGSYFVNQVSLEYSHTHLFTYCLYDCFWLQWQNWGVAAQPAKGKVFHHLARYRKSLPTSFLDQWFTKAWSLGQQFWHDLPASLLETTVHGLHSGLSSQNLWRRTRESCFHELSRRFSHTRRFEKHSWVKGE